MKLVDIPKWTGEIHEVSTLHKHLQTTEQCYKISTGLRCMGDSGVLCLLSSENFLTFGRNVRILCVHMFVYMQIHMSDIVCTCVHECVCVCVRMLKGKINSP